MKVVKRNFTLLELLAVIAIISILAFAVGSAMSGATEKTKRTQAEAVVRGVKSALVSYGTTYGRPPKELKDLLQDNNPRGISFFDGDEIPRDPYSLSGQEIRIVKEVSRVERETKAGKVFIVGGRLDGNGFVVYSVGPNGRPDSGGGLSGGVNDGTGDENSKDDISVFVSF